MVNVVLTSLSDSYCGGGVRHWGRGRLVCRHLELNSGHLSSTVLQWFSAVTAARTPPTIDSRQVRHALGISRDRMGRLLEVTAKTVGRLEDEQRLPAQPAVVTRLAKLKELTDLGVLVYTPEGFASFMATPLPVFAGLTALQLIERGEIERVFAELAATYEGVPA